MQNTSFRILKKKIVIRLQDRICENADELLGSNLFREIVHLFVENLQKHDSNLLEIFQDFKVNDKNIDRLIETLQYLAKVEADVIPKIVPGSADLLENRQMLSNFVENLYNFWRSYDRFMICDSEGQALDERPYRTFNSTVEELTHQVRKTYRDIQEAITKIHPRVYRQIIAGAEVATIAKPVDVNGLSKEYKKLNAIGMIRQVLLYPPLIFDPPMNKRKGLFQEVQENPVNLVNFDPEEWLCFPIKVGALLFNVYFHETFYELGFGLANLFDLADDEDLKRKPDAVYFFGTEFKELEKFSDHPTVYFKDKANDILVGAVPKNDQFGYFGYLKKMILTLHNIIMMDRGIFPFHGAMFRLELKNGANATVLLIGDSGAGKSESLEALRRLAEDEIKDITIIADDMGSIQIDKNGNALGYGTEIGAFLRLDDLEPGYAFGQLDRAIITNPNKVNARIVMPVTTAEIINRGYKIDFIMYANNYEQLDEEHGIIEQFKTPEEALHVFREGAVMSKGTTAKTGLTHSYFANVFGPPQQKELHEALAVKYFKDYFKAGIFIGQMRTRLGVPGFESDGPFEAARELLKLITSKKS